MNKFVVFTLILLLLSCSTHKQTSGALTEQKNDKDNRNYLPKADMKLALEYLASDELKGRRTGTIGIEAAAKFIENVFKEHKVAPYFKTYRDSFTTKGVIGYNIVAYVEGNDPKLKNEFVILGAHYDHIGMVRWPF